MIEILLRILGAALSPTRAVADYLKSRREAASFIRRWNLSFLIVAAVASASVYVAHSFAPERQVPFWLLLVLVWVVPFSRANEIFYAFFRDGLDRVRGDDPRIPLDAAQRVVLAARSYLETIVNFGLIYYLVFPGDFSREFSNVFEALYFSAVTITTLGYGDFTPRGHIAQFLSIYEVFIGFVLVVVALGAYLGGGRREAASQAERSPREDIHNPAQDTARAEFDSEAAAVAALNHARTMLIHSAELRVKNFNFFLVAAGVVIAAVARGLTGGALILVSGAGFIMSVLFFALDIRVFQLIRDGRADLYAVEPRFGIRIHAVDRVADRERGLPGSRRSRLLTTTLVYRALFVLMAGLSLGFFVAGVRESLYGLAVVTKPAVLGDRQPSTPNPALQRAAPSAAAER